MIKSFTKKALTTALCSVATFSASAQDKSTEKPATKMTAAEEADKVAKELANPNTSFASLTLKTQYRTFTGDLPGANSQNSTSLLFQPAMPFKRDDGSKIIFRPAIPIVTDNAWNSKAGIGDIAFDLAYAFAPLKSNPGQIKAVGIIASLPTGDEDIGFGESTTLGPEFLIGQITKESIFGIFPNHQWDIGGNKDVSLTTIQGFAFALPGKGLSYGSSPIMSYDHVENDWTIPLNATVTQTMILGGRPWKFSFELNYYVEQPDAFGPEWMIGVNITPVVENALANWFK
jgi:hypothetical protein